MEDSWGEGAGVGDPHGTNINVVLDVKAELLVEIDACSQISEVRAESIGDSDIVFRVEVSRDHGAEVGPSLWEIGQRDWRFCRCFGEERVLIPLGLRAQVIDEESRATLLVREDWERDVRGPALPQRLDDYRVIRYRVRVQLDVVDARGEEVEPWGRGWGGTRSWGLWEEDCQMEDRLMKGEGAEREPQHNEANPWKGYGMGMEAQKRRAPEGGK
jgi:hypothetical protein